MLLSSPPRPPTLLSFKDTDQLLAFFQSPQPTLGVTKSATAKLFVLIGPVGPYFPTGFKPVTLLADPKYVRAWPGGCGAYKMGA